MKQRCTNPNSSNFPSYGARGITVCESWLKSFENFVADVGEIPSPNHSLNRINNDGNYEPNNVEWASRITQARNTTRNKYLEFQGQTKTIAEWSEITRIPYSALTQRLTALNWSVEKALTEPLKIHRKRCAQ